MCEIEFNSGRRCPSVIMPLSECYKYITKTEKSHGYQYHFTVNAVDPNGGKLTKQLDKKEYDELLCRTVNYEYTVKISRKPLMKTFIRKIKNILDKASYELRDYAQYMQESSSGIRGDK